MVKHNCLSHKLWTDLFTWFDILKTSQIYAAIFFFFFLQIYVSNTSAGLKGSWPLVAGVLNDRWWEPTPIILHTFLHLSKLFQNILTSDSKSEAYQFLMEIHKSVTEILPQTVLKYSTVHFSLFKNDPCHSSVNVIPSTGENIWRLNITAHVNLCLCTGNTERKTNKKLHL